MPMAGVDAAWLRLRCRSLRQLPEEREQAPTASAVRAAVLIPVVDRPAGLTVLLTLRTAHLRDHAGQVSFPGGRCEAEDDSPVVTALREADEEIGLQTAQVEVLSVLPEYWTRTGFRITPVLGLVTPPLNLRLDDFEVAEVFEPPFAYFLDPAHYRREAREYQGEMREYWAVPWRDRFVWGATAGIFVMLRQSLSEAD